ncbi:MAG: DUF1150 family protein [Pseudomonadota bacterium]
MENDTNAPATPKASSIVYVREARREALPDELKGSEQRFYSLHDEAGNVLAVAPKRSLAFALAKRNDLTPVSVH